MITPLCSKGVIGDVSQAIGQRYGNSSVIGNKYLICNESPVIGQKSIIGGSGTPAPPKPDLVNVTTDFLSNHSGGNLDIPHEVPDGDNRGLVVIFGLNGGYNSVSCEYDGNALTKKDTLNDATGFGGFGTDIVVFELSAPDVGTANVTFKPGAAYNDQLCYWICSFNDFDSIKQTSQFKDSGSSASYISFDSPATVGSTAIVCAAVRGAFTVGDEINIPRIPPTVAPLVDVFDPPVVAPGVNVGEFTMTVYEDIQDTGIRFGCSHDNTNEYGFIGIEVGGA